MIKFLLKGALLIFLFVVVAAIAGYGTLRLIVSTPQVVVVPNLIGKDIIYALEVLTDLGLNVRLTDFQYEQNVPKNCIAFQDPAPGAEVRMDRNVLVVLSKGPRTVVIPKLVGTDARQANIILRENELEPGSITEAYHESIGSGKIVAQSPISGDGVSKGTKVDLTVSLGKRPAHAIEPSPKTSPETSKGTSPDIDKSIPKTGETINATNKK